MKPLLFFLVIGFMSNSLKSQQIFRKDFKAMGSGFQITVVAKDSAQAYSAIAAGIQEIKRIEKLISSWDSTSETSEINSSAGIKPCKISKELFQLIHRAKKLSQLTDGAFDISYASMDAIWKFDGTMQKMPAKNEITESVSLVGFERIILNHEEQTVWLQQKGMKIGFGAIGKGYAADMAKKVMQDIGITAGIVNASGDMNTWGNQINGKPWTVAITNPLNKEKAFATLPITDGAVVTSGNYEKFILLDGKRYSHIIDPRTGYPSSGIVSVTVFAPKAELADALATSVFVMGKEIGLDRINQIPGVECIIIDEEGKVHRSASVLLNKI